MADIYNLYAERGPMELYMSFETMREIALTCGCKCFIVGAYSGETAAYYDNGKRILRNCTDLFEEDRE